jgi:hypothetical protein
MADIALGAEIRSLLALGNRGLGPREIASGYKRSRQPPGERILAILQGLTACDIALAEAVLNRAIDSRLALLVARACQATASTPATDVRCIMRPESRS